MRRGARQVGRKDEPGAAAARERARVLRGSGVAARGEEDDGEIL